MQSHADPQGDGTVGLVDMEAFIKSETAGVFAALREEGLFREVKLALGTVTWPGDLDFAADAMHQAIKEFGTWVLE